MIHRGADHVRSWLWWWVVWEVRHRGGGSEGSEGEEEEEVTCAKLHIVDLAGSERIFRTGSTSGVMLKEAAYINKSLSFLEQARRPPTMHLHLPTTHAEPQLRTRLPGLAVPLTCLLRWVWLVWCCGGGRWWWR